MQDDALSQEVLRYVRIGAFAYRYHLTVQWIDYQHKELGLPVPQRR